MNCGEVLSYASYPVGHLFRLSVAVIILTGNCIIMRIASSIALLNIKETVTACRSNAGACDVNAMSISGSTLCAVCALASGSCGIVAAKRAVRLSFVLAFAFGCVVQTIALLLLLLLNGLRHQFNIDPVLVPDILEINLYFIINLMTMILGIISVKALAADRSNRYLEEGVEGGAAAATAASAAGVAAASTSGIEVIQEDEEVEAEKEEEVEEEADSIDGNRLQLRTVQVVSSDRGSASDSSDDGDGDDDDGDETVRPKSAGRGRRRRKRRRRGTTRTDSGREQRQQQQNVQFMDHDESGHMTDFGIFTADGKKRRR